MKTLLALLLAALPVFTQAGWKKESRESLLLACLTVNGDKLGASMFCTCLVDEAEKRIDEEAFIEWMGSQGLLRADEVEPGGNAAQQVCRDMLKSQSF